MFVIVSKCCIVQYRTSMRLTGGASFSYRSTAEMKEMKRAVRNVIMSLHIHLNLCTEGLNNSPKFV